MGSFEELAARVVALEALLAATLLRLTRLESADGGSTVTQIIGSMRGEPEHPRRRSTD